MTRYLPLLLLLWGSTSLLAQTVAKSGNTLVYVYGPDCGACMQFMAEAGRIYPKTEESKRLPMTHITFDAWQAGNHPFTSCEISPVFGTPTYIQLMDCQEVDRITGYSSDELWWFSLKRMIDRLPATANNPQEVSSR